MLRDRAARGEVFSEHAHSDVELSRNRDRGCAAENETDDEEDGPASDADQLRVHEGDSLRKACRSSGTPGTGTSGPRNLLTLVIFFLDEDGVRQFVPGTRRT